MNVVKQILDELSGDSLNKLSSLLGVDEEAAGLAVGAAAPSLLAGLADLASQGEGARKLTGALGGLGETALESFGEALGGDTDSLFQKGVGLLSSLFGERLLNSLSGAIAKYAGISSGTAKNLLTYLAPMILDKVAILWRSRGGNASALTSLFAEQKKNIADAMPAGFPLSDVPGLAKFGDAARTAGRRAEIAKPSAASWAVPLALVLVAAFLLWSYMRPKPGADQAAAPSERTTAMKPVVPESPESQEAAELTDSLKGIFQSAGETFAQIENAATADNAMPQLRELNTKLDAALASLDKLPQIAQNSVRKFVDEQFGPLDKKIKEIGLIPTLRSEVKTLIDEIVTKFKQLSGAVRETP
jgi:Bacterial protein of unknown function (DUF937)